jgi:hypothetical protein
MENDFNDSQSRRAAKVAGFASAIVLVGAASIKVGRFVTRKLADRRTTVVATPETE